MKNKIIYFLVFSLWVIAHSAFSQAVVLNGTAITKGNSGCSSGNYRTIASASLSSNCITLTSSGSQNGAFWVCNTIDISKSFDLTFTMNLGSASAGDGIAFVLQTEGVPNLIGGKGGGIGYALGDGTGCQRYPTTDALPAACPISPSVVVEFDTYDNSSSSIKDTSCSHSSILKNGLQDASNTLKGPACMSCTGASMVDGADHSVQITWDPAVPQYNVYVDTYLILSYSGNIRSVFSSDNVYWGFTGADGPTAQTQKVCSVAMTTNSTISVGSACPVVLPIELTYFNISKNETQGVDCVWETASETNSNYYELYRSADAILWNAIGKTKAAGNSSIKNSYSLTDNSPLPGISYYKLEQVDYDGKSKSFLRSINNTPIGNDLQYTVFPNPAKNEINIAFDNNFNFNKNNIQIEIYNLMGKLILHKDFLPNNSININVEPLTLGLYFIKVQVKNKVVYQKIAIE